MRSRPILDALRGSGFLFVHAVSSAPPAARAAWWPAVVGYTSQMQHAYFAWLAACAGAVARCHGRVRDPRGRRAGAARAARLARRRRPLVAAPQRLLRHRLVRPSSPRALHRDLRRRAARLRQRRAGCRPVARRRCATGVRGVRYPAHPSGQPDWIARREPDRDMAGRSSQAQSRSRPVPSSSSSAPRSAPSARSGRTRSGTTSSTGTTSSSTATPTSTSG